MFIMCTFNLRNTNLTFSENFSDLINISKFYNVTLCLHYRLHIWQIIKLKRNVKKKRKKVKPKKLRFKMYKCDFTLANVITKFGTTQAPPQGM